MALLARSPNGVGVFRSRVLSAKVRALQEIVLGKPLEIGWIAGFVRSPEKRPCAPWQHRDDSRVLEAGRSHLPMPESVCYSVSKGDHPSANALAIFAEERHGHAVEARECL